MEKKDEKMIPASAALIPFAVLLLMLFFVIRYFGSSALEGASQVALLVASAVCVAIAMLVYKVRWHVLETSLVDGVRNVSSAIVMLLLIGVMSLFTSEEDNAQNESGGVI